jgi:TPR repeat protein
MSRGTASARVLIDSRMQDALQGDPGACFDLGVAHSAGTAAEVNLIEAHKWFNLAALAGYGPAEQCRANLAWKMSTRELAEAERRTRLVQRSNVRRVARFSASAFA